MKIQALLTAIAMNLKKLGAAVPILTRTRFQLRVIRAVQALV